MLLQTSIYLFLATHLTLIQSQSTQTTCTDPNGCTWYCPKSNPCTNSTYNCTSIASSCTLNCLSCNGTSIISSSNDFNLICVGIHGCTNMDIIAQTPQNHIHIITASEPTISPTANPTLEPTISLNPTLEPTISPTSNPTSNPTFPPTINQSIIPIHQYTTNNPTKSPYTTTINQIHNTIFDGEIAVDIHEDNGVDENIDAIGGLLTFAGILTGMFCFCICIGICFVCHTKRKSKLRKNTHNDEYETVNVEYDKEQTNTQLSKEDKIIQELEQKIGKRLIVNNQTLTHINTNISGSDMNQLQITKTITPFSGNGNDEYDDDNKLIKQITPRVPIGNTISSYNENKKLNETDSSDTEVNDDSIDMNDITFNPDEVITGKNKGRHYRKINTLTNGISINIESAYVRDDMDDDDDSECEDALPMKPETSASVKDLVARYNKL